MRLEIFDNNNTRYIRIVESVRVTDSNGKRANRKRIIANIGPVSKYSDGRANYEERLRESFKAGKPLIKELAEFVPQVQTVKKYPILLTEGSDECVGHPKLYSHMLIEKVMDSIGVNQVVRSYKGFSKIQFDLLGYLRLMVYGRILNPSSKIATVAQNNDYLSPIVNDEYVYHIYDTLDFVHKHKKQIFNRINSTISDMFQRNTDIIYYDVTNFYFETDEPDEDITDNEGNIIQKGMRKEGVSKENRKQPIVQMGLFMDDSGIPVSYDIFPGNTLDHLTVRPALKNTVDNFDFNRFIFVGDRGMCTYKNILHILSCGNGYLVSKSIEKSKKEEKEWIFDDSGYTVKSENFKYKSRIETRTEKDENGNPVKITEKVVVYWDKYFADRQAAENRSFLEFLDKLLENPTSFRITAAQSKSIRQFLKNEFINIKSGELVKASELRSFIDKDKITEFKNRFGYYQIVTSEINKSDTEIIDIYHGLSRIEDQFKVMKGDLNTRPMFVNTPEHIDAHLAVCTISLIILRIIQKRITDSGLSGTNEKSWTYGMSAERIQKALNKWSVEEIADGLFRFNNIDDKDLNLILEAFNINIPRKLYSKKELKSLNSFS